MPEVNVMPQGEATAAVAAAPAPDPRRMVSQGPGAPAVPAPAEVRFVTLSTGRVLGWRRLTYLDSLDLAQIKPRGVDEEWTQIASVPFSIWSIDGEREHKPGSALALRALMQRIGDEGITAILKDSQEVANAEAKVSGREEIELAGK